jgi:hypothetical protein
MNSALVFDPEPQFKNQFVVLDWLDLKVPPAPQQRPFCWAAPSKHIKAYKSVALWCWTHALFLISFRKDGRQ